MAWHGMAQGGRWWLAWVVVEAGAGLKKEAAGAIKYYHGFLRGTGA